MKVIKQGPLLVAKNAHGEDKFWRAEVVSEDNLFGTRTESWQITKTGKESLHVVSVPNWSEPTNVGRANERDARAQALFEMDSLMDLKQQKGYAPEGKKTRRTNCLPMLAKTFDKAGHHIKWPAYGQPKLDGVRALGGTDRLWSRQGNNHLEKCVKHLLFDTDGQILDGELMLPKENYTFQETISAVKKFYILTSPKLEWWVYDIVDEDATFEERLGRLQNLSKRFPPNVKLVPTIGLKNEAAMKEFHGQNVADGWEGTIVRNAAGRYHCEHRVSDLQKHKDMLDEEFEIVGSKEGTGKDVGTIILRFKTKVGKEFDARPKATDLERRRLWNIRNELVGQIWTVRYQNMSDEGIPRFPVAIAARDYE